MEEQLKVVGNVAAIYFENVNNFYKVIRIDVNQAESDGNIEHEIVLTGNFAQLQLETEYQFYGKFIDHPKYGVQFAVDHYQQASPTTVEALVAYLASSRFKGIGKVTAQRIVDKLGMAAITTIIHDPEALKGIKGLKSQIADNLRANLREHRGTESVFMQLNQWGFSQRMAEKVYQTFGHESIELIQENPYILVEKIEGIGFVKADVLAEELGIDSYMPKRIQAGIYYALQENCLQKGDTYVEITEVVNLSRAVLERSRRDLIPSELITDSLTELLTNHRLEQIADAIMLPTLFEAEVGVTQELYRLSQKSAALQFSDEFIDEQIQGVQRHLDIQYDKNQLSALKTAIKSPISIITGGPGTGKTTLIKGLIHLHALIHDYQLEKLSELHGEEAILLVAPTGRAAKRMQEATGLNAATIHRKIGYTRESEPDTFAASELEGDLIIIDEMSMVDSWLMHWLMNAIPTGMQVVFVGDQHQLPSVGPGKVFSDLIASGVIPIIALTQIYRQAQDSSIIKLAHHIQANRLPADFLQKQADRTFIQANSQQLASLLQRIIEIALAKGISVNDLQVLAPIYKGEAGIKQLNKRLQEIFNPANPQKRQLDHFDQIFRVGDKVLQLTNNAEEGIYNGDIGRIEGIYYSKETESKMDEVIVSFDDIELTYNRSDLDQLTLAYCTSIHKAQGSEYAVVVLIILDVYGPILQKDLLYTAVTRAQQSLIMLGNPNSFAYALEHQRTPRKTLLKDLLERQFAAKSQENHEAVPESPKAKRGEQVEYLLTWENYLLIDPLINMEALSPYDDFAEEG